MATEEMEIDKVLEDDSPQLWTNEEVAEQNLRDAECEDRLRDLENQRIKSEERRKRVQRKLKGLGLRWKQVEQRRLTREESVRSLQLQADILNESSSST